MKAVLLDALGTLVRLEPPAPRLQAELARRGVHVALEQAERAMRAEIAFYREHLPEARDAESVARLRERCADVAARHLPPLDDPLAVLLSALEFNAFAEVPPVLRALRARGCRLVVVSNWDASLPEVLERTRLLPLLDSVVSSAVVGAAKPDPAIFTAALRLARATPAEAVHVGDTAEEDVAGARAAGIEARLLRRDRGETLHSALADLL